MNLWLGVRMALAGGRESAVRMVLMVAGIAIGVVLVLYPLTAMPVQQAHIDRLAWHRTEAASPATAPDPALWLPVTDRYAGRDVIRVQVAALGPQPPVPPGVDRLPGPGEVVVSPALAELMATVPDDQLRDRFPGRIAGTIGPEGLIAPGELVGIVGRAPAEMRDMHLAYEIRGIEQPGEEADLIIFSGILFGLLAALILGPVVVFVAMTTRIGGPRRELRFAALRLAGATRLQTAVLAATETVGAAIAGTLLGWLAFLALRPAVAGFITLGHGTPIFVDDLRVPTVPLLVVLLGVPVLAGATTLVTLRPVQLTPVGVRQRARRRPPRAWRLLPVAAGVLGFWYSGRLADRANDAASAGDLAQAEAFNAATNLLILLSTLVVIVGLFLAGSWVCMWVSRGLARLSGSATSLIVARRIAADPYSTFRSVSGAALAMFVATTLALVPTEEDSGLGEVQSVLDQGVVAVHVQGAPEESLAPLMSDGVVVARLAGAQIVVACADLARVTTLACPLPVGYDSTAYARAADLFRLPYPGADHRDGIVQFNPDTFAEPRPGAQWRPIQTLFIPTDGTQAAQERVRTLAAVTVPGSRSKTSHDLARTDVDVTGVSAILAVAMVFVLLVTACSLTVSVITGVLERRRPFALLRASGVRLGELRRIVLLETGVPLAATVLGAVGVALLFMFVQVPAGEWQWPSGGFLAGLGIGALAAFAVSCLALPFMDAATRHDSVRFE